MEHHQDIDSRLHQAHCVPSCHIQTHEYCVIFSSINSKLWIMLRLNSPVLKKCWYLRIDWGTASPCIIGLLYLKNLESPFLIVCHCKLMLCGQTGFYSWDPKVSKYTKCSIVCIEGWCWSVLTWQWSIQMLDCRQWRWEGCSQPQWRQLNIALNT